MVGLRAPGAEGGIEHVIAELAPRLVERGCEVTVYCRGRWNDHGRWWRGVELVDIPTVYTKHLETILYTAGSLPHAIAHRADVVHIHAVGPALLSFAPRAARIPVVVTAHGLDWKRAKWGRVARVALRAGARTAATFATEVIAVSRETAAWFEPHCRTTHVPNGVAPMDPAPIEAAGVPGLEPGYILFLGRLVPEKDVETLVRAHGRSGSPRPLVITGGGSHTAAYVRRLKAIAGDGVVFTGPRFGQQKAALFHNAACVAFPSRLEGLPLTVLEAMVCGRPALVSDIPPHREVAPDEAFAVHLPPGDVDAWAAALRDLDPDALADRAERARQRVLADFSWDRAAERTLDIYRRACERRTRLS